MTIGVQPDVIKDIPFSKITEITGITDRSTIVKTWQNCLAKADNDDNITADVISSLLSPNKVSASVLPQPLTSSSLASLPAAQRPRTNSMDTQTDGNPSDPVIDLTADDDIQKAIAASLENHPTTPTMLGGQISKEDQDISRVLEASLADTNSGSTTKSSTWLYDHANPHERVREDSWPVGLKNVGNTCWFNAVIQSLFHYEYFRDLVINYVPRDAQSKGHQIDLFMNELRRLFALMLASDRKYLNPSAVIDMLNYSSDSSTGLSQNMSNNQQDVSEFQHKLLDWLEEAFKPGSGGEESPPQRSGEGDGSEPMEVDSESPDHKDNSNPMVKLFFGKVKATGSNAGVAFTTHTHFGQWPLYIAGYTDIHESLEKGLAQGDIETNSAEHTSNQEQWFTHMPPLLTFELSRVSYNTQHSQAEKLHNKFTFPQTIYLDRYLEVNKEEVRQKRTDVALLKSRLSKLQASLHRYTHYGSSSEDSGNVYPLSDILDCALKFTSRGDCSASSDKSGNGHTSSSDTTEDLDEPRPANVTAEELSTVRACLSRWKEDVDLIIRQHTQSIDVVKQSISNAYDKEHLKQYKYGLHAVLVHEGQALSGHYWSYVYNVQNRLWVKFNDIRVTESSWEEVVRESEGGLGTASAYCLIYLQFSQSNSKHRDNSDTTTIARPTGEDFPNKRDALESLPADLQIYVTEDNQKFKDEIQKWDLSKNEVNATAEPQFSSIGGKTSTVDIYSNSDFDYGGYSKGIKSSTEEEAYAHAQSVLALVKKRYTDIDQQMGTTVSWNYKFELLVKACFDTYYDMSMDPNKAIRPESRTHMALYLLLVYKSVDHSDVKAIIADHIAKLDNMNDAPGWASVRQEAVLMTSKFWDRSYDFQCNYIKWHQEYHQFRVVFTLFVEGLTLFNQECYESALPYLHDACVRNQELILDAQSEDDDTVKELKSLDQNLISQARNNCLQRFNELAFAQFENEDDYTTPLKVMLARVLPILDSLQAEGADTESMNFAGSIKDRWVNLLADEENIEENRMKLLKEFIGQLFEPATNPVPTIENVTAFIDLKAKYTSAINQYNSLS